MSHNRLIFALLLAVFGAVAVAVMVWKWQAPKKMSTDIATFEQCQAAGYLVIQSYPPQCTLPNGKFFVQQTVPEK